MTKFRSLNSLTKIITWRRVTAGPSPQSNLTSTLQPHLFPFCFCFLTASMGVSDIHTHSHNVPPLPPQRRMIPYHTTSAEQRKRKRSKLTHPLLTPHSAAPMHSTPQNSIQRTHPSILFMFYEYHPPTPTFVLPFSPPTTATLPLFPSESGEVRGKVNRKKLPPSLPSILSHFMHDKLLCMALIGLVGSGLVWPRLNSSVCHISHSISTLARHSTLNSQRQRP